MRARSRTSFSFSPQDLAIGIVASNVHHRDLLFTTVQACSEFYIHRNYYPLTKSAPNIYIITHHPQYHITHHPARHASVSSANNTQELHLQIVQWNSASTLPYLNPSTFNSKASPALSTTISSVKSRLSNSTPRVVVNLVKRLFGTAPRSVVRVHTFTRSRVYEDGGSPSASDAIKSSDTTSDCPGLSYISFH